jgi:hypothetical protein
MKIGVVFPQTEIGQDPALIRDYAQAVESRVAWPWLRFPRRSVKR